MHDLTRSTDRVRGRAAPLARLTTAPASRRGRRPPPPSPHQDLTTTATRCWRLRLPARHQNTSSPRRTAAHIVLRQPGRSRPRRLVNEIETRCGARRITATRRVWPSWASASRNLECEPRAAPLPAMASVPVPRRAARSIIRSRCRSSLSPSRSDGVVGGWARASASSRDGSGFAGVGVAPSSRRGSSWLRR